MRKRVRLSTFSLWLTILTTVALIVGMIVVEDNKSFYLIFSAFLVIVVFTLSYAPLWISADGERITVGSVLRKHHIPLREIVEIEFFNPTMGARRICGSGGFMGYWGLYRESDIGTYTAYYGKASNCFLVKMRNGDKYVLGCEDPEEMAGYISGLLGNRLN